MTKLSEAALEARRAYQREYYRKHKDKKREYYKKNKDKIKGYQKTYWEKKAKEQENKKNDREQ